VETHAGVVDKYVGDAIVAIFGAPHSRADDSVRAVRTALGMVDALEDLNGELRRIGFPELASGIGINTGHVVAGNIGSPTRLNYTVIGDCVNLASRVEDLTKVYGVPILVTGNTKARAPSFTYREIDTVRVKGRAAPVTLYQPLGDVATADKESLAAVDQFHRVLADVRRRDWTSAHQRLTRLASASPTDRLYAYHLERIEGYLSQPPPADWDGVFTHPQK
jgi:adenylate cyclase